MMSILLCPTAAQFHTFSSYVFCSLSSTARHNIYHYWFELQGPYRICHAGPKRPWGWDPTLGLFTDLQAPQLTLTAATLSQA